MLGFFLNCDQIQFDELIFQHRKIIETRNKNMLSVLIGKEDVYIIKTGKNKKPMLTGIVSISNHMFLSGDYNNLIASMACFPIDSKYSCKKGKHCYFLSSAKKLDNPIALDSFSSVIRHGRSWCEFY